ncbi:hypothetical protein FACS1894172_06820 [Spirochaetia bacterium]|nr:hypothetical protein FACS1894164_20840 [Spirochaetia bacterium]GHU31617.1 hypothetical protein FACS1894172_06820 [Spirochaetia bacterium]
MKIEKYISKHILEFEYEDGSLHNYEITTFKMLDQNLETLERHTMIQKNK